MSSAFSEVLNKEGLDIIKSGAPPRPPALSLAPNPLLHLVQDDDNRAPLTQCFVRQGCVLLTWPVLNVLDVPAGPLVFLFAGGHNSHPKEGGLAKELLEEFEVPAPSTPRHLHPKAHPLFY